MTGVTSTANAAVATIALPTDSSRGRLILDNWNDYLPKFVKVMPTDYKRVLAEMKKQQEQAVA